MAPQKRARREADNEEIIAVERASSAFQQDAQRKKARLSVNNKLSKTGNVPDPSGSEESSSDDEMPDNIVEATIEPPESTQYEIFRDGGFEHLQHADEDDRRATQRFLARNQLIGDNHAVENAIIEEITCVNFMCHERLHVTLGPLINFVVGMNGSGKSAVLTAITLCLGGKASSTNRGASMKSLVKEGRDQAQLIVKLKNKGNDAYQPDVFGESIIVERHFSKNGGSGYKLKNAMGRIISNKKGDVDDIVEYFQLQVDNPMNILTQDAAKTFITASTPKQKYQFFVEGVQLQALDNDYKLVSETCDSIEAKLRESKNDIKILKKNSEAAQAKAKLVQQHEGMRLKAKNLSRQCAWAQVEEVEAMLAEREASVIAAQAEIERLERLAEAKDIAFQTTDEAVNRARDAERILEEESSPLKEEEEASKTAYETATKAAQHAHTQQRQIKQSMKEATAKVEGYKKDIAAEIKRMEDINGGSHGRKLACIQEAEQAAADAGELLQQNETELPQLEDDRRAATEALKKAAVPLDIKRREVDSARERLNGLNQNRGNAMAGYDPKMPRLLQMIERDNGFREKPVGPMGLHIKLLKPSWSSVLEKTLGNNLNAFVVTSKSDQMRLSAMMRQMNLNFCPVLIGNHRSINTDGHEPDPQFDTILKVLDIDDELVKRQLIIGLSIEQSILIQERTEAERVMFDGSRPRNVKQCFAMHDSKRGWGFRLARSGRTGDNFEINPVPPINNGKPRMKTDVESQIAYQRDTVNGLEREKSQLEIAHRQAQLELKKCESAIIQHKRDHGRLMVNFQRLEEKVEGLQIELEKETVEDGKLDGLKQAMAEARREVDIDEESYGNSVLEKESLNAAALGKKRELELVRERVEEHESKVRKAQMKTRNTEQARKIALQEKNNAIYSIEEHRERKAHAEAKRDKQAENVASFTRQASEVSARVPVDEGENPTTLGAKLQKLKQSLEAYRKKQGGSDLEINNAAVEAEERFQTATRYQTELEDLLTLLKQSFMKRIQMFRRFQRHISARSRINFNYLLSERAFRGKLTIDHVAKKLDVHVEPDETTKSGKGRQTKTLSGGEKSFSSICLLLSLWEAMGAPLRCLDEFDVFMDDVNRDVSTRMIISAARRSVGRQFILITPKALGAAGAVNAEDVKIIKLFDPRDKQQRIDDMMEEH